MANYLTQWKPSVFFNGNSIRLNKYVEIKRNLKRFIRESDDGIVIVTRSRRGTWGEWCEHWSLNEKGKPVIIKQTWL